MHPTALKNHFHDLRPAMLETIQNLVERESPSMEKPMLDDLARYLQGRFQDAGAEVDLLPNSTHGDHLRAFFPGPKNTASRPALILGHFDTVWPAGTLTDRPFTIRDDQARGPGIFDMKANLVLVEFALQALSAPGAGLRRPVVVLLTSDEEIGSPTSRMLIEAHARQAEYVLVVEPPLPGGVLKTARKGTGFFVVEIEGRAAHAGIEPEKGISAIVELAHQIHYLQELNDVAAGSTVNVGIVRGGTRPNVVAASAAAEVDVRVWTRAEAERLEKAILGARPQTTGTVLKIDGFFKRPPMERTPAIGTLFERAQQIGAELGMKLREGSTGGGSDGNFSAALGVPTLDGLGIPGAGAHAEDEHILIDFLPERATLLATLLQQL